LITTRPRGDRLPRTQNRERSSPSVSSPRERSKRWGRWTRPKAEDGRFSATLLASAPLPQRLRRCGTFPPTVGPTASLAGPTGLLREHSSVFSRHATLITMRPRSLCFLPSRAKRALGEVAEAKPRTEGAVPTNRARAPPPYPIGCAAAVLSPNGRPYGLAGETNIPLRGPTSRMISGPPWNACSGSTLTAALSQAASALPSRSRHTSPVADYRPASASAFSIRCSLTLPRVPSV